MNKEKHTNKIVVLSSISGKDIVKYYKNGTQYFATFLSSDGSLLTNREVTFNIYGVFYKRFTDSNGIAKLNINLNPGKYIITAIHPKTGEMHSNNITILKTLITHNLKMSFKDGSSFKAKLVNDYGKPKTGSKIIFNINGVFYERNTDNEGIARLNINLISGEYIITSYYKDYAVSNKITIN